jgi:hypothetical protein
MRPIVLALLTMTLLAWRVQAAEPVAQAPSLYLPVVVNPITPTPTSIPTVTPTGLPSSFNNCQADSNAGSAPNYPVRIVAIDKAAQTVTLQNVSSFAVSLAGWTMCSVTGNQQHPIGGTLASGQTITFPGSVGPIWNNSTPDPGALYNPNGQMVSYFNS